jgi:hypothetical protein
LPHSNFVEICSLIVSIGKRGIVNPGKVGIINGIRLSTLVDFVVIKTRILTTIGRSMPIIVVVHGGVVPLP